MSFMVKKAILYFKKWGKTFRTPCRGRKAKKIYSTTTQPAYTTLEPYFDKESESTETWHFTSLKPYRNSKWPSETFGRYRASVQPPREPYWTSTWPSPTVETYWTSTPPSVKIFDKTFKHPKVFGINLGSHYHELKQDMRPTSSSKLKLPPPNLKEANIEPFKNSSIMQLSKFENKPIFKPGEVEDISVFEETIESNQEKSLIPVKGVKNLSAGLENSKNRATIASEVTPKPPIASGVKSQQGNVPQEKMNKPSSLENARNVSKIQEQQVTLPSTASMANQTTLSTLLSTLMLPTTPTTRNPVKDTSTSSNFMLETTETYFPVNFTKTSFEETLFSSTSTLPTTVAKKAFNITKIPHL